ncbi:MAG: TfoX/Sxy family protein [Thermoleophilia bacterium]|nr:TfoX/Sxy family protein [Thermoleophilia bacterium]
MSTGAKPPWPKSPSDLVERFVTAMDGFPAAELRAMFGYPCAFLNGHMFTGLHGEQWFVRLDDDDRASLLAVKGAGPFEPMPGRPMAGYAVLPGALTRDPAAIRPWIERAEAFVGRLPPKAPASRSKKSRPGTGGNGAG